MWSCVCTMSSASSAVLSGFVPKSLHGMTGRDRSAKRYDVEFIAGAFGETGRAGGGRDELVRRRAPDAAGDQPEWCAAQQRVGLDSADLPPRIPVSQAFLSTGIQAQIMEHFGCAPWCTAQSGRGSLCAAFGFPVTDFGTGLLRSNEKSPNLQPGWTSCRAARNMTASRSCEGCRSSPMKPRLNSCRAPSWPATTRSSPSSSAD